MGVVAKFQVVSIELFGGNSQAVKMRPVYAGEGADPKVTTKEDGQFWEATPTGNLEMTVNNPNAAEQFQPGDKFYLTFERASD